MLFRSCAYRDELYGLLFKSSYRYQKIDKAEIGRSYTKFIPLILDELKQYNALLKKLEKHMTKKNKGGKKSAQPWFSHFIDENGKIKES